MIFRFASKRNEINVFSHCFASKRNDLNIFFASFHFTRYRLDKQKYRYRPKYFSSFLNRLSQNFTLSFFTLKFLLLFRFFSLTLIFIHFFRIEAKKISLPFRFILLRSENDGTPYLLSLKV